MSDEPSATRSIDIEITIDAPVEAVWEALSKGDGLEQWFSPEARVNPGVGGSIWLSWGEGVSGEGRIEVWEPNRRLVWSEPLGGKAAPLLVDFELEAKGGTTRLRMVHSGFGASADWDEQYDATKAGWTYFLFHLAFYLVRHRGRIRRMVSARRKTARPVAAVWKDLLGSDGLGVADSRQGSRHAMRLGGVQAGQVEISRPPHNFAGTLTSLNDGLVFVEMEMGTPEWHCGVWVSVYDLPDDTADLLQSALDEVMDAHFPEV